MSQYTIKDVTQDLSFLLTLTNIFAVDEDGYVVDNMSGERFIYKMDSVDEGRPIVVYQDPIPKGDYYVFNPFSEGLGPKSPAVQYFYKVIRYALNVAIEKVSMYALKSLLESKQSKDKVSLGHEVIRITAVQVDRKHALVDVVDEKMIEEFETLFERMKAEFLFVAYHNNRMTAAVKTDILTDPKWDEKYGDQIRKKSLAAFKALIMGVLGIESPKDLESFSVKYDPEMKSAARLHTTMSVYLKLYSRFNDLMEAAYAPETDREINLNELQNVIEKFPLAYAIAKHMIQPTPPRKSVTDTSTTDTSGVSFANTANKSRFPGPPVVDAMGRVVRPGEEKTLSFGQPAQSNSRFKPHIVSTPLDDPFNAPVQSAVPQQPAGFISQGTGFFSSPPQRPQNMFGGFGTGGLSTTPPLNFGSPGTRRSFFS